MISRRSFLSRAIAGIAGVTAALLLSQLPQGSTPRADSSWYVSDWLGPIAIPMTATITGIVVTVTYRDGQPREYEAKARTLPEQVDAIRSDYAAGGVSHRALAAKYGLKGHTSIGQILRGTTYTR